MHGFSWIWYLSIFRKHVEKIQVSLISDKNNVYLILRHMNFMIISHWILLHPLWPQNKWLHTPRTTDYMHTRQVRWIQTELAFTLAKNATKPNPFEIIPLQATREENNWKTEESLARAAVTLETERIKGSNSWCLWWRWWWILLRMRIISEKRCRGIKT